LYIFLQYFDNSSEKFVEEILNILPLLGTTCGKDISISVITYFEKYRLDIKKLISVTIDRVPSTIGSKESFVQRLINSLEYNKMIISYHCIIYLSVLSSKLNINIDATMAVMAIIIWKMHK